MSYYTIRDLEKLSGIKAHTIRIWEQRYKLIKPHRTDTNIRYYNDEHLKHLLNVSLLVKTGMKISKIGKLTKAQVHEQVTNTFQDTQHDQSLDERINGLMVAMVELDEEMFDKIFSTVVLRMGFEETIVNLIYPFLSKVGMMWGINEVNPAQEHFISNLIRQKIITAIDGKHCSSKSGHKYLLFLPEGELHELGLLLANYVLKANGERVYYLGQNVPFKDVKEIIKQINPEFIITFFVTNLSEISVPEYLKHLVATSKTSTIYFSGNSELLTKIKVSEKLIHLKSLNELKKFIVTG